MCDLHQGDEIDRVRRSGIVRGRHATDKRELAHRFRREMTQAEEILWQAIRASRLDGLHFRRQKIIDGFIVDFFCRTAALIVEVDCFIHDEQVEYDQAREDALRLRKLKTIRFTNHEVQHDLDVVLQRIRDSAKK